MTADLARLTAIVHGYVQGVGFRMFAAREGSRLGLAGSVWNRADGTVEVIAEGDRAVLEELLRALQRGPSEAEVRRVDANWSAAQGCPPGFQIIL
jgi:acylphosphatase